MKAKSFSKVGIIGTGRYGGALARGLTAARSDAVIWLYDKDPTCAASLAIETNARKADTLGEIVRHCDLLVIAVSDDAAGIVLEQIAGLCAEPPWIVCISSGLTREAATQFWDYPQRLIRALPNILVRFGCGQIAVSLDETSNEARRVALALFEPMGQVFWVEEAELPVFRASAGVAPGLISYFFRYLFEGSDADRAGKEHLQEYWLAACKAAVGLLLEGNVDPRSLASLGVNPGGATEAALEILNDRDVAAALREAAKAASQAGDRREKRPNLKAISQ
jgi:pyrroline-5-carboxylate reductase